MQYTNDIYEHYGLKPIPLSDLTGNWFNEILNIYFLDKGDVVWGLEAIREDAEKKLYNSNIDVELDINTDVELIWGTYAKLQDEKSLLGKYKYPVYKPDDYNQLSELIRRTGKQDYIVESVMDSMYNLTKSGEIKTTDLLNPRGSDKYKDKREDPNAENLWQNIGLPSYSGYLIGGVAVIAGVAYLASYFAGSAAATKMAVKKLRGKSEKEN